MSEGGNILEITAIDIQKHNPNKVSVFVDGKYSFSITVATARNEGLCVGKEISEEMIQRIKGTDEPNMAFIRVIMYLDRGLKTEKECRKKLHDKGFSEEAIEFAIKKAKDLDYINDERYVERYIEVFGVEHGRGEYRLKRDLFMKGIDKDVAEKKIEELYSKDDKYENAYKFGKKKYEMVKNDPPHKAKQKVYQHLSSKGFSSEIIIQVIEKLINA